MVFVIDSVPEIYANIIVQNYNAESQHQWFGVEEILKAIQLHPLPCVGTPSTRPACWGPIQYALEHFKNNLIHFGKLTDNRKYQKATPSGHITFINLGEHCCFSDEILISQEIAGSHFLNPSLPLSSLQHL